MKQNLIVSLALVHNSITQATLSQTEGGQPGYQQGKGYQDKKHSVPYVPPPVPGMSTFNKPTNYIPIAKPQVYSKYPSQYPNSPIKQYQSKENCRPVWGQKGSRVEMPRFEYPYLIRGDDEMVGSDYEAQSAYCKLEQMWDICLHDRERQKYFEDEEFDFSFKMDVKKTFDFIGDSMPYGRKKQFHSTGVVAKVKLVITNREPGYTGLFATGADWGILRISEFADTNPDYQHTIPGFGIKFFRDGCPSANSFAMYSFDGQKSFNFFKNSWSNHIPPSEDQCTLHSLQRKFLEADTDYLGAVSVKDWAEVDQQCRKVREDKVHWPYKLRYTPLDLGWSDTYVKEFYDQMMEVPEYLKLFKVEAIDGPDDLDEYRNQWSTIGYIMNTSRLYTSMWADQRLFFQHHRVEADLMVRPEWEPWLDDRNSLKPEHFEGHEPMALRETNNRMLKFYPEGEAHCPFAYLFRKLRADWQVDGLPAQVVDKMQKKMWDWDGHSQFEL